jgi:CelD/BcsL family acetyltransferase involved in cellulose biosynthesis
MSTITVSHLTPDLRADYMRFVSQHPQACYGHDLGWADVLQKTYGFRPEHLVACDADRVVGVLPLFFSRSLIYGRHYTTSPFLSYFGPLYESGDVLDALLRAAKERTTSVSYTRLVTGDPLPVPLATYQLHPKNYDLIFLLPLDADPARVFGNLSENVRRNIRKAQKQGAVEVVTGHDGVWLEEFYQLYVSIYASKHGLVPHPKSFFHNLFRYLAPGTIRIYLARYKGRFIAAILTIWAYGEIHYAWSAADPVFKKTQPITLPIWQAIHDGCTEGYRLFNMGAVPKLHEGLAEFKRRWCTDIREAHSYFLLGRANAPPAQYDHFYDGFHWPKKLISSLPPPVTTRLLSPLLRFLL